MREVGRCPEVDVHLLAHSLDRSVEEKRGDGGAGVRPDDLGRLAIIPGSGFGEDAGVFGGGG